MNWEQIELNNKSQEVLTIPHEHKPDVQTAWHIRCFGNTCNKWAFSISMKIEWATYLNGENGIKEHFDRVPVFISRISKPTNDRTFFFFQPNVMRSVHMCYKNMSWVIFQLKLCSISIFNSFHGLWRELYVVENVKFYNSQLI